MESDIVFDSIGLAIGMAVIAVPFLLAALFLGRASRCKVFHQRYWWLILGPLLVVVTPLVVPLLLARGEPGDRAFAVSLGWTVSFFVTAVLALMVLAKSQAPKAPIVLLALASIIPVSLCAGASWLMLGAGGV